MAFFNYYLFIKILPVNKNQLNFFLNKSFDHLCIYIEFEWLFFTISVLVFFFFYK